MSRRRVAASVGPVALTALLAAVAPVPAQAPTSEREATAVAWSSSLEALRVAAVGQTPVEAVPDGEAPATLAETDLAALETDARGVPTRAAAAYRAAADRLREDQPGCRLRWEVIAAIGRIESDHGRYGGSVVLESGRVEPAILGPRLDGGGPWRVIRDTDGGAYDGDAEFDRAVGPMQFIPSTWARWGSDGDGDGVADPQDLDDAALAAGRYLCASGRSLARPENLIAAVFSYNHSYDYVRAVLTVAARYAGVTPESLGTGLIPVPAPSPSETPLEPEALLPEPVPMPGEPAPQPGAAHPLPPVPATTTPEPTAPEVATPVPAPTGEGSGTTSPTPEVVPTDTPAPEDTALDTGSAETSAGP